MGAVPSISEPAAKLAFLRASHVFDGVVDVLETHMSWVFLTEEHAFKLKKPVQLPFVDYRTIARRRQSCENELRLGRRLAHDVYEAVVPLVVTPHGLAVGGPGEIVDWLVVMHRLPADRMLPELLARGAATLSDADALGQLLARFYAVTARVAWSGREYRDHLHARIEQDGNELLARGASRDSVLAIVDRELAVIARDARTLDARIGDGRVVDAHGDIRPEHVCFAPDPQVIDPLEFDDDLRALDAASELAFFLLECERLGARWFAVRVIERYANTTGDRVPHSIAALYRGQHALTRALIALRHLDDVEPGARARWRAKAADYLARALVS